MTDYLCAPTVRDLSVGDATFITASDTEVSMPLSPQGGEPVSPETLFYGFCEALGDLHRHVHSLPQSAGTVAIAVVVERLRELTQELLPLVLAEERRQTHTHKETPHA